MLNIVYGCHGQGKTSYLLGELASLLANGAALQPLFVVPEQFHFETERSLYYKLGRGNISKVEITSFTKLSAAILSKRGENKPYCDDSVKLITVMKAIDLVRGELFYYRKRLKLKGFPAEMLSVIDSFKREGITGIQIPRDGAGELGNKLRDISLIYEKYSELLEESFSDRLDDTARAAERTDGYFAGRFVFFDGFDGFSGSQKKLIAAIMNEAVQVSAAFSIDAFPSERREYIAVNKTIQALITMAAHQYELRQVASFEPRQPKEVEPVIATDVYEECDYIAAAISDLAFKEKFKFNDIAVLTRNKDVMPIMTGALEKYGIAAFADIPVSILEKPLIRFVLQLLEAAEFSGDGVINYICSGFLRVTPRTEVGSAANNRTMKMRKLDKTGLYFYPSRKNRSVRLGRRDINRLAQVAYSYNIKGELWKKPFPDTREFRWLEPLRQEIIGGLEGFAGVVQNTTGDKITEALSDFLINKLQLGRTMLAIVNKRSTEFKKGFQIDKSLSDEYRQLWELLVTSLESMHSALADYPISLTDYREMLRRVFAETNIARSPQVIDAVTVGDIERTRTADIKVAFVMNAVSGVFPKSVKPNGAFSSDELEEMSKLGLEFLEDRKGRYYREQYIVHKTLSLPTQKLVLSAPRNSLSWDSPEPSPLFEILAQKYNTSVIYTNSLSKAFFAKTHRTLEQIAARSPDDFSVRQAVEKYSPSFSKQIYDKFGCQHTADGKTVAALLNGREESPTSIKALASCPFSYFCKYVISIYPQQEENTGEPSGRIAGNLVHHCVERITGDFGGFMALSECELESLVKKEVNAFAEALPYKEYTAEKTRYLMNEGVRDIRKILSLLQEEFKGSPFGVQETEKCFSFSLGGIPIKGRIDRVDKADVNGETLLRVVDYKSGKERFDWDKVYYGLDLQILLYLFANDGDGTPSGAFIKNTSGRISKSAECSETLVPTAEEAAKNWLDSRRISGVQLTNGVDEQELERISKLYASKAYKTPGGKKAEFVSAVSLEREEYENLKEYLGELLEKKKENVLAGIIPAIPVQKAANDVDSPCTYCDYKEICGNEDEYIEIKKGLTYSVLVKEADEDGMDTGTTNGD